MAELRRSHHANAPNGMMATMDALTISTSRGEAHVSLHQAESARGLMVIGPGASGKADSRDIRAVPRRYTRLAFTVAVVTPLRRGGTQGPAWDGGI